MINDFFNQGDLIDNKYKVLEKLGGGGFGKVVKVYDINEDREIALKYCSSLDQTDTLRFKREVRILEGIQQENVVEIISNNVEYEPPYFTMPVALYSVTKVIPDLKDNIEKIIEVFEEICKGINAIHISGFTHRDIKPDNVLIYDDERIVVSDLGLGKYDNRDTTILTRASVYIGTDDYMPPEQKLYSGTRDADHRGDIFQLGKTFYHLLTGLRPFLINPQAVHVSFRHIIKKATRDNPDDRYQSVGQLLDAIHDAKRATEKELNTFQQELAIAIENLKIAEYNPENLSKLMQYFDSVDNLEDVIEMLHSIPDRLLPIYSGDLVIEFEPVLEKYRKAIRIFVDEYPFSFAETVSKKMKFIFRNASSPDLKKDAILATLISAVRLNRFAAMDDFDWMIKETTQDTDAHTIADGLKDELKHYEKLYSRIPKKELHPALKLVWEACENLNREQLDD